ncbi:uncharacterized protein ARB_07010 [Trichophyton benhamiae CBS 112371]|uniref:Uncharacterized protein n=1 Tax=Arthroderma benhamiae (strain ATCC MYA-4681 / CBS 112371) TaxID=663331 RepID=D4ARZ5_ARTBC|nr:uncharacterized protein ARB_07010 [Trichophyton benhamiae CBS 112371]EFE34059.1 hypothetical protein ARB_07010 [Trichophyton benhamiae CBS 112371]
MVKRDKGKSEVLGLAVLLPDNNSGGNKLASTAPSLVLAWLLTPSWLLQALVSLGSSLLLLLFVSSDLFHGVLLLSYHAATLPSPRLSFCFFFFFFFFFVISNLAFFSTINKKLKQNGAEQLFDVPGPCLSIGVRVSPDRIERRRDQFLWMESLKISRRLRKRSQKSQESQKSEKGPKKGY